MFHLLRWLRIVMDVMFGRVYCRGLPPLRMLLQRTTSSAGVRLTSGEEGTDARDCAGHLTVIVTGPTSGIGMETARCFAECGARVVMACRTVRKGEELAAQWRAECPGRELRVEVMELDMASLESVRKFAREWRGQSGGADSTRVDALINNAGVFDMSGKYSATDDGFEAHFGVNYLAQVLLTLLMLPYIRGRIVMVSSKLNELGQIHTGDYNMARSDGPKYGALRAYSQSKLAQIMFAATLQQIFIDADGNTVTGRRRVLCLAVHPGNAMTHVTRTLSPTVQFLYRHLRFLLTPEQVRQCRGEKAVAREQQKNVRQNETSAYF